MRFGVFFAFALGLGLGCLGSCQSSSMEHRPVFDPVMARFFADHGIESLKVDSGPVVYRLGSEADPVPDERLGLWAGPHPFVGAHVNPKRDWTQRLLELVGDVRSYEWRFSKECAPTPGVVVRFAPSASRVDQESVDIFLCFECDMLGIGCTTNSPQIFGEDSIRWADFDHVRGELLALVREVFPADGLIAGIRIEREEPDPDLDIDDDGDYLAPPSLDLKGLSDPRVTDFGIEAWCSLFLAKGIVEKRKEELDDDIRLHALELLVSARFGRHDVAAPIGPTALRIHLSPVKSLGISAHLFQISADLRSISLDVVDGKSQRWMAIPEAAIYWHHMLSYQLDHKVDFRPTGELDPEDGIWADWLEVDSDDVPAATVDKLGREICDSFCFATRLSVLGSPTQNMSTLPYLRMPVFYQLKRLLADPNSWRHPVSVPIASVDSEHLLGLIQPEEDCVPIVLRVAKSSDIYGIHQQHSAPRWFRDSLVADKLRPMIKELSARSFKSSK